MFEQNDNFYTNRKIPMSFKQHSSALIASKEYQPFKPFALQKNKP